VSRGRPSPHHVFLSAGNVVNLFLQSAHFMVFAMAETFALLLGEIDLSIGYVGPVGGAIAVQLVQPVTTNWPWEAAILVALLTCAVIGAVQGTLVTRLRLPSFIVTLAGLLIFNGALLIVFDFGPFSGHPSLVGRSVNLHAFYDLMWGHVSPLAGWIIMVVVVGALGLALFLRDARQRRSGLVAPPLSITFIKVAAMAAAGVAVVVICNLNRAAIGTLEGVPYAIFIVLGVLGAWTFLLQRTRYGRYIYAIGGNPEAARRAGINVNMVPDYGLRPLFGDGGDRRPALRLVPGGQVEQCARWPVGALCRGRRRHRGNVALRREGKGGPRCVGRSGDRRHLQRYVPPRPGRQVGVHRHRARSHRGGEAAAVPTPKRRMGGPLRPSGRRGPGVVPDHEGVFVLQGDGDRA